MKGNVTRGRKRLQMLSDVISNSYEELKGEVEDSWWKKRDTHKPATQGRKPEETGHQCTAWYLTSRTHKLHVFHI